MVAAVHAGTLAAELVYNGLLLLGGAAALAVVRRNLRPLACLTTAVPLTATAVFLAAAFPLVQGGTEFGAMRLLAWGIFLHGPLFLIGCGLLLSRAARWWAVGFAACAVVILAVACNAFLIEPTWLQITHVEIVSSKVTRPVRVAVVADLQTDRFGEYERSVLRKVVAARPDAILFAGDYVQVADDRRREQLQTEIRGFLAKIELSAPLGVYAVRGNVDSRGWSKLFQKLPVKGIYEARSFAAGDELTISGLSWNESVTGRFELPATDRFHILLGHSPNFALHDAPADLLVAGHTHGGQVRLPGIGPLRTASRVPRSWAAGRTDLGPGRTLVVSRGIGHERLDAPRLRFLCRPELVMITIRPKP